MYLKLNIGGPDEFSFYREKVINGVIDRVPPAQYGYALPLKEEILFGEEMKVLFTEQIECSKPLTFDVVVTVTKSTDPKDTIVLRKEDLLIICEDRQIKLQIDYTRIPVKHLNGNNFVIEIGKIGGESKSYIADVNGNKYDHANKGNIRVEKKFASIDLSRALTEVIYSKDVQLCDVSFEEEKYTLELHDEIVSHIGLTNNQDRVRVSNISCHEKTSVLEAMVQILPSPEGRRFLKNEGHRDTSIDLFEKLRDAVVVEDGSRSLLSSSSTGTTKHRLRNLNIIPSDSEKERYSSTEEQMKEEKRLLSFISDGFEEDDTNIVEMEVIASGLSQELNKQRNADIMALESRLEQEKKEEMEELKKEKKEEMEELETRLERGKKEEMEDLKRELIQEKQKEKKEELEELKQEMKSLAMQGMFVLIGCSVTGIALYLTMRRN